MPYLEGRIWQLLLLVTALIVYFTSCGHYRTRKSLPDEVKHIFFGCGVMLVLDGYLQYALKLQPSRLWVFLNWSFIFALLFCFRVGTKNVLCKLGLWQLNTMVVGAPTEVVEVSEFISRDKYLGYDVSDVVIVEHDDCEYYLKKVEALLVKSKVGYVVFAFESHNLVCEKLIEAVGNNHKIPYGIIPAYRNLSSIDMEIQNFFAEERVLLHTSRQSAGRRALILKRIFDFISALLISLLLALPSLIIALLVKLDGGPILYKSPRLGYQGKLFNAYKFRSMIPDASQKLESIMQKDEALRQEWESNFKLANDPRITRVGSFLRRSSLDELPQLINVLRGEMSLVGPRPMLIEEVEEYGDSIRAYSSLKPGITGVWQVSGRSDIEYKKRITLNNWYVRNWSLWGDLMILMKTVFVVLKKSGAR